MTAGRKATSVALMKVEFDSQDPVEQVAAVVQAVYGVTVHIEPQDTGSSAQERNRHDTVRLAGKKTDDDGQPVGT